jgi:hypothetical protein
MADNLTAEQLAWLRNQLYQPGYSASGYTGNTSPNFNQTDSAGNTFHTSYNNLSSSTGEGAGMDAQWAPQYFLRDVVAGRNGTGDLQDVYDTNGNFIARKAIPKDNSWQALAPIAMAAGAAAMGLGAGGAGAGMGAGDVGMAGWVDGMPAFTEAGAGLTGAGTLGATTAATGATKGLLSSILPAGASSWLGPAATLLGAAAGAQGQEKSQTETRKTDPRVDPYLFGANGQNGLLQYAYNQLAQDMSPERQAELAKMRAGGMGLMAQPVAGNGFNLLTRGRYQ